MPVRETDLLPADVALHTDHLLLLALGRAAAPLGRLGLLHPAVPVHVEGHGQVGRVAALHHRDGARAQRADGHAGIRGRRGAVVAPAGEVGGAEVLGAAGALHGQEVEALAGRQVAVGADVGELHVDYWEFSTGIL